MEHDPTMGAGPETTGSQPQPAEAPEIDGAATEHVATRRHDLRPRADYLHTRDHPIVRGDRLETSCTRPHSRYLGGGPRGA